MNLSENIKKFIFSSSIYLVSNAVNAAVPFFFLPVLTRWLTPADYGYIGTFNAIRANMEPAVTMSSAGAVCRAHVDMDKKGFDFPCYIFNAMAFNLALFFVVAVLLIFLQGIISDKLHFPVLWVWFVPLLALFSSFGNLKAKLWIYQEKPLHYGTTLAVKSLLNVGLSLLIILLFWFDWRGRIAGIIMAEIIFFMISFYFLLKEDGLHFRLNKQYFRDVAVFGVPLYPHSLGLMMIATVDKFFLNALHGMEALGVYNVGYTFGTVIIMLAAPVDNAVSPHIYRMLGKAQSGGKEKFVCFFVLYLSAFIAAAFVVAMAGPYILRLLVGEKFYGAEAFIFWIAMSQVAFAMYRLLAIFITFSKKTYLLAWITLLSGLVALAANFALIKLNGVVGAAQATFLAYLTFFILTLIFVNRLYPMPWRAVFELRAWKGALSYLTADKPDNQQQEPEVDIIQ